MFYDRFVELCRQKGVKPGRACTDMDLSRSLSAKWKATKTEKPSTEVLEKMSEYFGMSINEILGGEKAPAQEGRRLTDHDLMTALFGDAEEVTAEDLEDVRRYADYIKSRRKGNGGKGSV